MLTNTTTLARILPSLILLASCGGRTPLDELANQGRSAGGNAPANVGFVGPIGAGGGSAAGHSPGHGGTPAGGAGGAATSAGGHAQGGHGQGAGAGEGGVGPGGPVGPGGDGAGGDGAGGSGAGGSSAACANQGGPGVGVDAWIAFEANPSGAGRNLFAIRADGCDLTQLTSGSFVDTQPAWSPDGGRIAFSSNRTTPPSLHVLDLATHAITSLGAECTMPAWSPDGGLIVCGNTTGLRAFLVADPSQFETFTTPTQTPPEWPLFTPDGSSIVYDTYNEIRRLDITTQMTTPLVPASTDEFIMPAISPSQDSLALVTFCTDGIQSIWAVPYGGFQGEPCHDGVAITPAAEMAKRPAWGPANLMAYQRGEGPTTIALVVVGAPGTPHDLTSSGNAQNPSWSPQGISHP